MISLLLMKAKGNKFQKLTKLKDDVTELKEKAEEAEDRV